LGLDEETHLYKDTGIYSTTPNRQELGDVFQKAFK
jgi:hypothetical protein